MCVCVSLQIKLTSESFPDIFSFQKDSSGSTTVPKAFNTRLLSQLRE